MSMEIGEEVVEKKFGFKGLSLGKNAAPKKLQPGVLNEETVESNETDFITGVEERKIESEGGNKAKPEELVIPLQPNNLFKGLKRGKPGETKSNEVKKRRTDKTDTPKPDPARGNDLDAEAMNELIEDAQRENEDWENRDLDAPKNLTIPGQENRNLDEENSESDSGKEDTDYEKVPISSFGLAMLRGMGWKEGEGIGTGDRKKVIDPIQAVARPKGLGLGADRSAHQTKNQVTGKSRTKRDDEELELKKGVHCQITEGKNEDMYGEVIGLDEESSRVFVKLTLGESISVSQFKIRLVSKTEYGKFSKYINKGQSDKYKDEERKAETREREKQSSRKDDKRGSRKDGSRKEEPSHEKRKKRKLWLRPQLRVRVVDEAFSKGKYFKEKVRILDVSDRETCQCRTDGGKLLTLKQHQLETVIPRDSRFVCVIDGQYAGSLGEILEKDKVKSRAMVQLLADRERVLELAYDNICEYTGDVEADLDY